MNQKSDNKIIMKKSSFIIMLVLGITSQAFAQNYNEILYGSMTLGSRHVIRIQLDDHSKLFITTNDLNTIYKDSIANNLNTLLNSFVKYFKNYKDTIAHETDSRTIQYSINGETEKPIFKVTKHSINATYLGIVAGEFVGLKAKKDTIIITRYIKEGNGQYEGNDWYFDKFSLNYFTKYVSYYFIVNDVAELAKFAEMNLDSRVQEIMKYILTNNSQITFEQLNRKNSIIAVDNSIIKGRKFTKLTGLGKQNRLIINAQMGAGWVRERILTNIEFEASFLPGNYTTGLGLGISQQFHFETYPDQTFKINNSTFLNLILTFYKYKNHERYGNLSVGYLVRDKSNFYPENTWRAGVQLQILKHFNAQPELYWNGLLKNVYPSLRISVGI